MRSVTSDTLERRLAAVLCYMLWIVSGLSILIVERDDRFVRFHALQSIMYSSVVLLTLIVLTIVGLSLLTSLLGMAALAVWVTLMFRAARGEWWELPLVGSWSERIA